MEQLRLRWEKDSVAAAKTATSIAGLRVFLEVGVARCEAVSKDVGCWRRMDVAALRPVRLGTRKEKVSGLGEGVSRVRRWVRISEELLIWLEVASAQFKRAGERDLGGRNVPGEPILARQTPQPRCS